MSSGAASFPDLRERVLSAIVMIVVGAGALIMGGGWFVGLLAVAAALMVWESLRMLAPKAPTLWCYGIPAIAGIGIVAFSYSGYLSWLVLGMVPVLGALIADKNRLIAFTYLLAILIAVAAIMSFRLDSLSLTLWMILVVIAADVGGYLAGRTIGGPKILPKISPKKTWSGTVGGWVLAALVGIGFSFYLPQEFGSVTFMIVFSVVTAAASQLGDVVESAIKRHSGVKDSSNLIPGHGGLLDRFDGMIGAALFVGIITLVSGLSVTGGL